MLIMLLLGFKWQGWNWRNKWSKRNGSEVLRRPRDLTLLVRLEARLLQQEKPFREIHHL